jgi:two-component sensor histidine kinase
MPMNMPLPPDEQARLAALHRYAGLTRLPQAVFDRFGRLASSFFRAPIALVSFIDADRQWFKSCLGLDLAETPRDIAFCAYTILSDEVCVVEDATRDARFAGNPLVTGYPGIRFYAAAPVRTPDGFAIGTVCVIDVVPRTITAEQRVCLRDLAAMVAAEVELQHAFGIAATEVTTRRQAEERLREALAEQTRLATEKALLLRELHHRIKNNLQLVVSLIRLRARQQAEPLFRRELLEMAGRIHALGQVQDRVYETDDLGSIDFCGYLATMAPAVVAMAGDMPVRLDLRLPAPLPLPVQRAVPLGLLCYELVLNVVKHAFVGRTGGTLTVAVHDGVPGQIRIADDGIGGFDPARPAGKDNLGWMLVRELARQADVDIEVMPNEGGGTAVGILPRSPPARPVGAAGDVRP